MLPGGKGRDNFIIVVACISDLHNSSSCGLSGVANAASGTAASLLPISDDRGILAAPLLVTACLIKVVDHHHLSDVTSPHTRGLWREGVTADLPLRPHLF